MSARSRFLLPAALLTLGCGGGTKDVARLDRAPPPPSAPPLTSAPPDPLGPVPAVALAPPFEPPAPAVWTTANGITVWLLERHAVPIVAVTIVIPTGSSSDPKGEPGLADQAVQMLGEGAGKRGSIEFARAVDDLGARLDVGVSLDSSHAHLGVVKRNFATGMQLLGDAVVHPRWAAPEWRRLHSLWRNNLEERGRDPEQAAHVVASLVLYGQDHPYSHPIDGLVAAVPKVQLADAKRFWSQAWRPDRATIVVVGDVTREELDPLLETAFGAWSAPATPPPPIVTPPPPVTSEDPKPRLVLVDRPDAPQAVVQVIRPGIAAGDPRYPALSRANIALGGSFTSRLNADLREARGWTYGASSWITAPRSAGAVAAGGAFAIDKTADALKALLADVDEFARAGMTEEEVAKTRMQARSEIVDEHETVDRLSLALARNAGLGLGPDSEAKSSVRADRAKRSELNELAAAFFGRKGAAVVVVGPRAKLEAPLIEAGFGPLEYRDAEGAPVHPDAKRGPEQPSPARGAVEGGR